MLNISVFYNSGANHESDWDVKAFSRIRLEGHAGSAEYGFDLVCASASILTINFVNSIEVLADDDFSVESNEESGMIDFKLSDQPTECAQILIQSLLLGLESLADEHSEYVSIDFKEV